MRKTKLALAALVTTGLVMAPFAAEAKKSRSSRYHSTRVLAPTYGSPGVTATQYNVVVSFYGQQQTDGIINDASAQSSAQLRTLNDIQKYLKTGSVLYNSNGTDLLGNQYSGGNFSVDTLPKLSDTSFGKLSDVAPSDFWSPFYP